MLFLFYIHSTQTGYVDKHICLTVHFSYLTHKAAQLAIALRPELEPRVILGCMSLYET